MRRDTCLLVGKLADPKPQFVSRIIYGLVVVGEVLVKSEHGHIFADFDLFSNHPRRLVRIYESDIGNDGGHTLYPTK